MQALQGIMKIIAWEKLKSLSMLLCKQDPGRVAEHTAAGEDRSMTSSPSSSSSSDTILANFRRFAGCPAFCFCGVASSCRPDVCVPHFGCCLWQ